MEWYLCSRTGFQIPIRYVEGGELRMLDPYRGVWVTATDMVSARLPALAAMAKAEKKAMSYRGQFAAWCSAETVQELIKFLEEHMAEKPEFSRTGSPEY
jgi:hypothetical protein